MLTARLAAFEIRYQLRNPVFWVSVAIFFLLGFGIAASSNVSIGTPGAVHENSPFAVTIALAILGLFYLFVITSFVANAVVRDDVTGFGPMIRATPVGRSSFLAGRFLGGLVIAILGYRDGRTGRLCDLCVAIPDYRHSQPDPVISAIVQPGHGHPVDAGQLYRGAGAGGGLFAGFRGARQ
jgi:hypothetical protein